MKQVLFPGTRQRDWRQQRVEDLPAHLLVKRSEVSDARTGDEDRSVEAAARTKGMTLGLAARGGAGAGSQLCALPETTTKITWSTEHFNHLS